MLPVAIIGGDGVGKTTTARRLEGSLPFPVKYLYMGVSTQSSNHALLTSRLVLFLKRRAYGKKVRKRGRIPADYVRARELDYGHAKRGPMWLSLRFLNGLAEAWYRKLVSVSYQIRGYVVVYDRRLLFDTAPLVDGCEQKQQPRLDGLYHWIMSHLYPKPKLTILLDAPADVLYRRKGEATPEYLSRQRKAFIRQGKKIKHFIRVDATQPIDKMFDEVVLEIGRLCAASDHSGSLGGGSRRCN